MGLIKDIWKFRHTYNKWRKNKMQNKPVFKRSIVTSHTTQNVAAASIGGGLSIIGIIKGIRVVFPDVLPWDESMDEEIAAVLGWILTPVLSRLLAYLRRRNQMQPIRLPY